ncbi:MAG: anti-sigma factor, partial [Bacteroidota bacterium]
MNWKTYIESGQLEAYVAGLLSETEMQEADRMIQQHPEVAAEVAAIRQAVAEYAPMMSDGPQLPPLERILEQ